MEKLDVGGIRLVRELETKLASGFVGREEEARVAVLALLTKQHAVFVGEPGIAKSALIRRLSQLVNCRFFYYLLSKYTVPDELIGAIDPVAYKNGKFVRNTAGRLPQAELAFIDEVFKGSSETLNTLLNIMNERIFVDTDGTVYQCPLHSLFGASNELPSDSELAAFYDRFLIRHFMARIDSSRLEEAVIHNLTLEENLRPVCTLNEIRGIYDSVTKYMRENAGAVAKATAQMVMVLREHGIFVSDRTAVSPQHLPRLIATHAYVYGADLKKSAIEVSKYVLPSAEAMDAYKKALDSLMPVELREASDKLDRAKNSAVQGNLAEAKRLAQEAIQVAQTLLAKPEKAKLYEGELRDLLGKAERLVQEIMSVEARLREVSR
jgi:MoxR-like ATPase